MICPKCDKEKLVRTSGKKLCMGCGYEEGGNMAGNPALFKTKVKDKQAIEKKHNGCDDTTLRISRVRLREGRRYMVYVCNSCSYEEERLT